MLVAAIRGEELVNKSAEICKLLGREKQVTSLSVKLSSIADKVETATLLAINNNSRLLLVKGR